MTDSFVPRNELESKLLAAQRGEMASEAFMEYLMGAQVFVPVQDDGAGIQGFQRTEKAVPLTLADEQGAHVLVLFTSPERARGFLADFPGFDGGIVTEFNWIMERVGADMGVSLNPGWVVGIDMEAELLRQFSGR